MSGLRIHVVHTVPEFQLRRPVQAPREAKGCGWCGRRCQQAGVQFRLRRAGLLDLFQDGQFRLLLAVEGLQASHDRVMAIGHAHHRREAKGGSRESRLHAKVAVREPVVQATFRLVREAWRIGLAEDLCSVLANRLLRVRDLDREALIAHSRQDRVQDFLPVRVEEVLAATDLLEWVHLPDHRRLPVRVEEVTLLAEAVAFRRPSRRAVFKGVEGQLRSSPRSVVVAMLRSWSLHS